MNYLFACFFGVLITLTEVSAQTVTPHPVPEEFSSKYYEVKVNGQSVPVFHAGLNVYFASFDFTGNAEVTVTATYKSAGYSGQTTHKEFITIDEKGYWRGAATVRPLSKNIQPTLTGNEVHFSLTEAGQYSVERAGTGHYKDDALLLFANRPEAEGTDLTANNVIHLKPGIHHWHIDLKS